MYKDDTKLEYQLLSDIKNYRNILSAKIRKKIIQKHNNY